MDEQKRQRGGDEDHRRPMGESTREEAPHA
jgi:hypothetical protein